MTLRSLVLGMLLTVLLASITHAATYPITYHLEKSGKVSVNIYDANGMLVRELIRATQQPIGDHTLYWDGRDAQGNGAPAGNYSWKLLQTPGISAEYLLSIGSNYPLGWDWRNACGPGTHGSSYGVAVDTTGVYMAAGCTENIETSNLKLSLDGTARLWTNVTPTAWDGARALAVDNSECYMLGNVDWQRIYAYNATTGALLRSLDIRWDATTALYATDMDICNGVLVVAYAGKNAIRWYNPTTGALIDSATITAPQGVTVAADGTVYVTTGSTVVKLTQANHTLVPVASGLTSPGRLDIEHGDGTLLVFQGGTSQQIVRLDASGIVFQTYGAAGGRLDGIYNATTKKNIAGFYDLCTDGAGGFYISEPDMAPRRVAHFNNAGSVTQEWYGGTRWAPHAAPEPGNPNAVWVSSQYGTIMRTTVDYTTKTWQVHSSYRYQGLADGLVRDTFNEGSYFQVFTHNGTKYLVLMTFPMATICKIDEVNWRLVPMTVCDNTGQAPQFIRDWGPGKSSYQWNDANGDGRPQQSEVTYYTAGISYGCQPTCDANFTCYAPATDSVRSFPVASWNAIGAPIYGNMPLGVSVATYPARYRSDHFRDMRWAAFLHHDSVSGRLYGGFNSGTVGLGASIDSCIQAWDATGAALWTVSEQGPYPGQIHHNIRGLTGVTHDCFIATDMNGGWNGSLGDTYIWDQYGLFVGGIMDNPNGTNTPLYMYSGCGEFCHSNVYTFPNGDVYFYGIWENEARVYKVTGWDDWVRKTGALTVSTPSASTGQGLTAEYFDNKILTDLRTTRVDGPIDFTWGTGIPSGTAITAADSYSVRWRGTLVPKYGPTYTGGWTYLADAASYDGSVYRARDMKAGVTFAFPGTSVSLVCRTTPASGYINVYVDGVFRQQVDLYSATDTRQVTVYQQSGLAPGDHTITVEVLGWYAQPRNPASPDAYVHVDKIVIDGGINIDDNGIDYTFYTLADDGVEFTLGSNLAINDWTEKASAIERTSAPIRMHRGHHPVTLKYFKNTGSSRVALSWSSPVQAKQVVPATALYPATIGTLEQVPESAWCSFVGADTTTQGNWKNVYGQDGYNIAGDAVSYPSYATVTMSGVDSTLNEGTSTDVRHLQKAVLPDRIAAAWTTYSTVTYDINLTDGQWHKVAMYLVNLASDTRDVRVDVLDATGTRTLDTQYVGAYTDGKYLVWNLKGHVQIRVTKTLGASAMVSGIFFCPVTGPIKLPNGTISTDLTPAQAGWGQDPQTIMRYAFDGTTATEFNTAQANGWSLYNSLPTPAVITQVRVCLRLASRHTNDVIEGSNVADFSSGVQTLATLTYPLEGWNTLAVNNGTAFRYLRYRKVSYNYANIQEIEVYGTSVPLNMVDMDMTGNAQSIPDGQNTPLVGNDTDFGSVLTGRTHEHTFSITNSGTDALNLTGNPRVTISGTHAADFTVVTQPSTPVAAGGQTTCTIRFTPGATGLRTARVSIANNSEEAPFDFAIQGTGVMDKLANGTISTNMTPAQAGWGQDPQVIMYKAFDGNTSTEVSTAQSNGWSLFNSLSSPALIGQVRVNLKYTSNVGDRHRNDIIEGCNVADFSSGVQTLATLTGPVAGWNTLAVSNTTAFRYLRYRKVAYNYSNILEIEFYGMQQ